MDHFLPKCNLTGGTPSSIFSSSSPKVNNTTMSRYSSSRYNFSKTRLERNFFF